MVRGDGKALELLRSDRCLRILCLIELYLCVQRVYCKTNGNITWHHIIGGERAFFTQDLTEGSLKVKIREIKSKQ